MKNQFLQYVESRPTSANSGQNYLSGINAISERFLKFDLFTITSENEVEKIIIELERNPQFVESNKKGHNMYLRALKHYFEFLCKLNSVQGITNNNIQDLSIIKKYIAIEMLTIVAKGQLRIEYNELADNINKKYGITLNPHTQVPGLIGDISEICYKKLHLPMISCVVVNKDTQLPGIGFYKLYDILHGTSYTGNKYFEEKCRNQVKKDILECNEWYKLAEYLNVKIDGLELPNKKNKTQNNLTIDEKIYSIFPEEITNETYPEGAVKQILVNKYERNTKAKKECIKYHGTTCKICGFKFSDIYGEQFENKIHVHHLKPISEIGEEYKIDPINDLIPVCPNCHMIIHSKGKNEVYSVEEVKKMIEDNKS